MNPCFEMTNKPVSYIISTCGKWNFNLIECFQFKVLPGPPYPKAHTLYEKILYVDLRRQKVQECLSTHWHGRPLRLSHEEDTLVNNSGLITVKMHHQMYFIMLYGCHSLTFIYHFLVVGQWNAGFEIKSAMIHVSAVSVLH